MNNKLFWAFPFLIVNILSESNEENIGKLKQIEDNFREAAVNNLDSILIGGENESQKHDRNMREDDDEYQNFRVEFITAELEKMNEPRIDFLLRKVLPEVQQFYLNALKTKPFPDPSIRVAPGACFGEMTDLPEDIEKNGVENADLVIYVKAEQCGVEGAIAAASPCSMSAYDFRPLIGIIYFCLESEVLLEQRTQSLRSEATQVAIHEITHVLGMNSDLLPFFLDRETGEPYLPNVRFFSRKTETLCVDGTKRNVLLPSEKVLQLRESSNGALHYEIVTPTVRTVTRNQFNCQEMTGARLENQPTAPNDCFGSHWDERLFYTEAMSAFYDIELNAMSSITIALLEDTGWYIGNYSIATKSTFGHGAGCEFVNNPCIVNGGEVPSSSRGFFCNSLSSLNSQSVQCTPTHKSLGYCDLFDLEEENIDQTFFPPAKFQYFNQDAVGPLFFDRADFCPISIPIPGLNCQVDNDGNIDNDRMCVNIDSIIETYRFDCVKYICNNDLKKLQISVENRLLTCDRDFQKLSHPSKLFSRIECPRLAVMCPDLICPSNCSGKGVCDYSGDFPKCLCFDETDKSKICNGESMPTMSPTIHPTAQPTSAPSKRPSIHPSSPPSGESSSVPSTILTLSPSEHPSSFHSSTPTIVPTSSEPTNSPTAIIMDNPGTALPTESLAMIETDPLPEPAILLPQNISSTISLANNASNVRTTPSNPSIFVSSSSASLLIHVNLLIFGATTVAVFLSIL